MLTFVQFVLLLVFYGFFFKREVKLSDIPLKFREVKLGYLERPCQVDAFNMSLTLVALL